MQASLFSPSRRALTATALLSVAAFIGNTAFAGKPTLKDGNIRISSNENAFGFSPKALERMKEVLDSGNYYNNNESGELAKVLAAHEGVPLEYIMPTAGSGPVLDLAAMSHAAAGLNVVSTETGYAQLVNRFKAFGGDVKLAPLSEKMGYDFKALGKLIDDKTAIVYICNPNNPTGVLADPVELKNFILSVPEKVLVFMDEAYLELSDTGLAANTQAALVKVRKNMVVSRTFSKAHAMAGLRVGYAIGNPEVMTKLRKYSSGGPSYLACVGAIESIKDKEHMAENVKKYIEVRNYVKAEFDRLGIKYAQPQGSFVYFNANMKRNDVVKKLQASKVVIGGIRGGVDDPTGGGDWTRVSLGTMEEMSIFIGELSKILGKS